MMRFFPALLVLTTLALLTGTAIAAPQVTKLVIADGLHVACHQSHSLSQRNPEIRHAVIVIHGTLRNSASYFDRMSKAAELSAAIEKTLVVAPGFQIEDEVESDGYYWSTGGWKQGDLALNGRDKTKVSSFDVADRLIALISDRTNFPALETIAIVGHSAGGQFVNRYAAAARLGENREADVRFIVINPSSYWYPDGRRLREGKLVQADELSRKFVDYDHYRYGAEQLNTAMRRIGLEQITKHLLTRQCYYFAGTEDTADAYLDMLPGAMAQGRHRFERFCNYRDYVDAYEDDRWRKNSEFVAIEGIGHSSTKMFATAQVRKVLFGELDKPRQRKPVDELRPAREFSKTLDTAAVVIMHQGKVLDQWGAIGMPLNCHSIRKSILSALFGPHVDQGVIDLDATLKQLGIDDNEPSLTEVERGATLRDLLKARSGVYHPALYETAGMAARRPERGSHAPNTFWYYNNWDFNASCTIFENLTGRSIFEEFESRIAKPLGMQDFRRDRDTSYVTGDDSVHPAYPFHLSTRDLAKFGQLMLQQGRWKGKQLIPESWVRESTASYSNVGESGGYGYMWWVALDGDHFPGVSLPEGSYSARGNRGQYLVVIPKWELVICHRVNSFQKGSAVSRDDFGKLLAMIIAARPKGATPTQVGGKQLVPPDFDILIRGGEVIDGTGKKRFPADVAVKDGFIVEVCEQINGTATQTIDATGKLVCPGFIDLHSHAEKGLVSDDPARRSAPNLITQGITTVVVNQDGGGPLDLKEQRQTMQRLGVGLNVIQTLGHGVIRREVMGDDHQRPASPDEISEMKRLLRTALRDGAFGMSAGLEYVPGRWSTPREMEKLAQEVANAQGVYIVHERSSGSRPMWFLPSRDSASQPSMIDNLRELILIADITKVTTVATHIKARGTDFWGSSRQMNSLIRKAREQGLPFYADQYPYNTSGSDGRIVLIPAWALEDDNTDPKGTPVDFASRLKKALAKKPLDAKLRRDIKFEITRRGGAKNILVVEHRTKDMIGKSLAEIADSTEQSPVEVAIALQLDGDHLFRGGCRLRAFSMSEADVETFAKTAWTATSSDAGIALPQDGLVHPRYYGAFPRKIRRYAIDRELFSIEEAIRVSTSLPSKILRLKNRGVILVNAVADIVVFDPSRIRDKADTFNPHQYSEGIDYVLVNGKLSVSDEGHLGCLAGKVLRRQQETTAPEKNSTGPTRLQNAPSAPSTLTPQIGHQPRSLHRDKRREVEAALRRSIKEQGIPGLSVAIAVDNEFVYAKGFGRADVENKIPVTTNTKFRTASIAKSLTAVAVMSLVEDGKLNMDADVQYYCPGYPYKRWRLTPRQLLGHLGGVRHYEEGKADPLTQHFFSLESALDTFKNDPLLHKPGTKYHYSTFGYNLLGSVAEGASDSDFIDLLYDRVLRPAEMRDTVVDDHLALIKYRTRGYGRPSNSKVETLGAEGILRPGRLYNAPLHDTSMKIPGGGLLSTPSDLVRFGIALNQGRLLEPHTREVMWSSQRTLDGESTDYGLGWRIKTSHGQKVFYHGGSQPGTRTALFLVPKSGTTIAIMSNLRCDSLYSLAASLAHLVSPSDTCCQKSQPSKSTVHN